jgi:hypothetical protein
MYPPSSSASSLLIASGGVILLQREAPRLRTRKLVQIVDQPECVMNVSAYAGDACLPRSGQLTVTPEAQQFREPVGGVGFRLSRGDAS